MNLGPLEHGVLHFRRDEKIKYDFLLFVPQNIKKAKIMLWCHGSTFPEIAYNEIPQFVKGSLFNLMTYCENHNLVAVMPILPRKFSQAYPDRKFDAQAMTAEVVLPTSSDKDNDFYKRPDLEVIKILDQVKDYLSENKVETDNKIIVGGSSAGGSFANRFSLLHPLLVEVSALLIAGDYIYPESRLGKVTLNYPYGIADLKNIMPNDYSFEEFKKIKHFLFVGEEDKERAHDALNYELNGDAEKMKSYREVLGENAVERTKKYADYLKSKGIHAQLIVGKNMGHRIGEEVMDAMVEFIVTGLN